MPPVAEGQVLTGAQFAEPVRVETIKQVSPGAWEIGVSGLNTQKFRKVTLSAEDFKGISASMPTSAYTSKGEFVQLGVQAYALGIAYEFDAYADVVSIKEAMRNQRAPFYLRRTKEAMHYFPEKQPDGTWDARKIFTKRIPKTVSFAIDGEEDELYRSVTPTLQTIFDPARFQWEEVLKVAHYALPVRTIASGVQRS